MYSHKVKIRAEVLNRLQSSISKKESKDMVSYDFLQDLSSRLKEVNDFSERKKIINSWYRDLLSADRVRKHHLSYKNPNVNRQLNIFLSNLTTGFRERFHGYMN